MKGITLKPKPGQEADFFTFESDMELVSSRPPANLADFFASFGPTDFLIKQSILPVVAWVKSTTAIRCIGTGFVVSCSGFVVTASHVLLDPQESGYADVIGRDANIDIVGGDMVMGVLMPVNPAYSPASFALLPFQQAWYWGKWRESPLLHEHATLESLTDIALCKLPELGDRSAYQPLQLSLHPFSPGEEAYAIGYAEMGDIPIEYVDGKPRIPKFDWELYVSKGAVAEVFPLNHVNKEVPTPGPCFDFQARIPGKMSGSPIFGAQGAIVRGVVSRSFSGEKHAYGCMMGPAMTLLFGDGLSLERLRQRGSDGIAVVHGRGL